MTDKEIKLKSAIREYYLEKEGNIREVYLFILESLGYIIDERERNKKNG